MLVQRVMPVSDRLQKLPRGRRPSREPARRPTGSNFTRARSWAHVVLAAALFAACGPGQSGEAEVVSAADDAARDEGAINTGGDVTVRSGTQDETWYGDVTVTTG